MRLGVLVSPTYADREPVDYLVSLLPKDTVVVSAPRGRTAWAQEAARARGLPVDVDGADGTIAFYAKGSRAAFERLFAAHQSGRPLVVLGHEAGEVMVRSAWLQVKRTVEARSS